MPESTVEQPPDQRCQYCQARAYELVAVGAWRVCSECVTACDRCGDAAIDVFETVNGDYYCHDCSYGRGLEGCIDCSCVGTMSVMSRTSGGGYVCPECRDRGWYTCDGCGELFADGGDYCEDCESNGGDAGGLIYGYCHKPLPIFHGSDSSLHLGVELEVNVPRHALAACASLAMEHLGDLGYLKEDSSVDGFEIVTHPMTPEYAHESFPWRMLNALADNGCEADNVGLHVHVSRAAFDDHDHAFRWLRLIRCNRDGVTRIARRESDEWAAFRGWDERVAWQQARGEYCGPRYQAVNCGNSETFELRVFASTLKTRELQAALELAAGSVEYTRDPDAGYGWSEFINWADGRPEYAALVAENEV